MRTRCIPAPVTDLVSLAAATAVAASFAAGCSKSERPPLGVVGGTVTLDGRPLPLATVCFTPDGRGRTSIGTTAPDGRYELTYLRDIAGANLGRHAVRILTAPDDARGRERLPKRYHSATVLEATVAAGRNTCDFALTSDAR